MFLEEPPIDSPTLKSDMHEEYKGFSFEEKID